ncbi:MAG: type II toxin-antitoxin system HicA family toxin [Vampirovibrionales bacterium]|nr:type II toxin-antitoxin system HicA family toxin [Vampirovibrionales bacterium]
MTQREKLLQKLLNGQPLSFDELYTLLEAYEFQVKTRGSHYNFRRDSVLLTIPRHGKTVKTVYLKKAAEVLREITERNDTPA